MGAPERTDGREAPLTQSNQKKIDLLVNHVPWRMVSKRQKVITLGQDPARHTDRESKGMISTFKKHCIQYNIALLFHLNSDMETPWPEA